MSDVQPFSLEIKEPEWKVKLPDGSVKSYDPWEAFEKLQKIPTPGDGRSIDYDAMRVAFGFPTSEEVEKSDVSPKPFTPSRNGCMELSASLQAFIANLEVSKKLAGVGRK